MDFDQSFAGPVDWNFPSPHATPTHHTYGHDVFQTPKTSTISSHFHDAFTTPQIPSYATPRLHTPYQHGQVEVQPQQYIPPPQSYPQHVLASSPQAQWEASMYSQTSSDPTQIQTPPPTRDTDARKSTHLQQVAFGTPSTIAARRFMTPQQSQEPALHLHFPQVTQPFTNTGPATAPVKSTNTVWNLAPSPLQGRQPLEDPFMSNIPTSMAWSFQENPHVTSFGAPLQQQLSRTFDQSMAQSSAGFTSLHATSGSVDPSLVYSSPMPALPPQSGRSSRSMMQDAQAELRRRVSANSRQRTDTMLSGDVNQARPGATLRRSNTTGSTRTNLPLSTSFERVQDVQPPRTASPLKRIGRTPLGSISESFKQRHRTSVILTVDESGIARTETRDDSPTRSMKARYPGLFDSDSSEGETEASSEHGSRRASFAFSRRDERKQKAVKLDPPIEKFEGLSIPRSSSSVSLRSTVTPSRAAVAAAAQLRRQGSLRRSGSLRQSSSRTRSTAPIDTCPMNVSDEQSWSASNSPEKQQFDFQPLPARRQRPPRAAVQNTLDAHNRRWSLMSTEQQHHDIFGGSAQPTRKIRCVCGTPNEQGQDIVQCILCTQWSHVTCVGIEKASMPQGFTCLLCVRPVI